MITGSNNPFACNPVVFANANTIVSLGTITRDGNQFTFSVGFVWKINGVTYQNTAPVVLTIAEASTGFKRIDNALLNTSNTIELQQGLESETIALRPVAPDTNIILTSWNISGDAIGDTETPIVGTQFKQKNENQKFNLPLGGTTAVITIQPFGQNYYSVGGPVTGIVGFSKALITASPTAEVPYAGKDFYIENKTDHNVTLKNAFSPVDIPFNFGADLVVPTNGIVWLKYNPNTEKMDLFFKSWSEVDLSTKLNKDTTAGVERAYIVNADGSQGTKATSDFKDVLEFANLASFPATGETGKIYLAIDTNKTYRWSGSVYVKIGGINQDLYPIKYWYQATGVGMGTYGTNVMAFQGTQSDVYVSANLLSYRKIASAATAGTSIFARETSFFRVLPNKGFQFLLRFRIADAATISDVRGFHGLQVVTGFSNTNISANIQPMCGIGCDGTDTNIHIFSRQVGVGTLVKIDTGFSKTLNHEYLLTQERLPNSNDVVFTLKNLTSSTEFTSTVVNNSSNLTIVNHRNNNASTLSCGFEIQRQELNLSE